MQDQKKLRCVVCDDHEALRMGLVRALEAHGMEVVGQAGDGGSALPMIVRRRPDVAILDLHMPGAGGIEIARALREDAPAVAVLLYSADENPATVHAALDAGVAGYILKRGPVTEVSRAVELVASGESYLDPTLMSILLAPPMDSRKVLTPRESQVLQLLADGMTTQAAASELFLAPNTVRSYIENAMQKLGTNSRTAAVANAMREGIIT